MKTRTICAVAATAAMAIGAMATASFAQSFPQRPITLIVPWSAGGSTDQTTRVLAKAAESCLGQPIIVVNKQGASTTLGMTDLANAKPDGYTIGTLSSTTYLIPLAGREVQYDMMKDFDFISYYGDNLIGIAMLADKPWKTLGELVQAGKDKPGAIKFGTGGIGATQHLTIESLMQDSGAKFVHIPQKGSAASMPALLGGHVDFISETSVWAPFVESGQVRVLAVTTPKRSEKFPDVPTLEELGYKSLRSVQGIIGPAGIPAPVKAKLEDCFRKALDDKAFKETMSRLSMVIVDLPGAEFRKMIESEIDRSKDLLEKIGKAG